MGPSKASITDTFEKFFFMNHTFCVFVRIASKTYVFTKNNMGMSMKKIHDQKCADRMDVITNFAVITNVVI